MGLASPTAGSVKVKMSDNESVVKSLSKLADRSVFFGLKKGSIQPHETNISKTFDFVVMIDGGSFLSKG